MEHSNGGKLMEMLQEQYPKSCKVIFDLIRSGMSDNKDMVVLFLSKFSPNELKVISMEINKPVSYTAIINGKQRTVSANLFSELCEKLIIDNPKVSNPEIILTLTRNLESAIVSVRQTVSRIDAIRDLLFSTQKELDSNVALLKKFITTAYSSYRGLTLNRILEERLPSDNPQLKVLIEAIEVYRRTVHQTIVSTHVESTDAVTHLDRFIDAYKRIVTVNIQFQLDNSKGDVVAAKALEIVRKIESIKGDDSPKGFDYQILTDNHTFTKLPEDIK